MTAAAAPFLLIEPGSESKLAQLQAMYAGAESKAKAAAEQLSALKDAIKHEMYVSANLGAGTAGVPEQRVELSPTYGPPLRLTYKVAHRVDTKALRAAYPQLVEDFTKESGAWELRAAPMPH